MNAITWRNIVAWLLAGFFVLGGTLNVFASPDILADYQRWGYPRGFNYVTGLFEWTAAVLIAVPRTRMLGSLVGAWVMAAAAITVLLHAEYSHAIPPLVVMSISLLASALSAPPRKPNGFRPGG